MKIRLLLVLVGLAISFALSTYSQQKEPSTSEQEREQIIAIGKKNDEAWSKSDAVALAALFTEDAVFVTPGGILSGREAIEKRYQDVFTAFQKRLGIDASPESSHITNVTKPLELHPIDNNTVWGVGQWSQKIPGPNNTMKEVHGNWGVVNVRVGDTWKTRMLTVNVVSATGAATPSPTTTPISQ